MLFLKAQTIEGKTEFFNAEKILTIKPDGSKTKILMGAGMFFNVKTSSMQWVHHEIVIMEAAKNAL
jgi:hypothetical protein